MKTRGIISLNLFQVRRRSAKGPLSCEQGTPEAKNNLHRGLHEKERPFTTFYTYPKQFNRLTALQKSFQCFKSGVSVTLSPEEAQRPGRGVLSVLLCGRVHGYAHMEPSHKRVNGCWIDREEARRGMIQEEEHLPDTWHIYKGCGISQCKNLANIAYNCEKAQCRFDKLLLDAVRNNIVTM